MWVQVPDETTTLVNLARQGLVVAAGSTSFVNPPGGLLRVSVLQLPDDCDRIDELAEAVRAAVHSAERGVLRLTAPRHDTETDKMPPATRTLGPVCRFRAFGDHARRASRGGRRRRR